MALFLGSINLLKHLTELRKTLYKDAAHESKMEEMHGERYMGRTRSSQVLNWDANLPPLIHVHQPGSLQTAYVRDYYGGFITRALSIKSFTIGD